VVERGFSLMEFLDEISFPVGTAMKANFKGYGKDLDETFLNEPATFYRILLQLYSGDEASARAFLHLLAATLSEKAGVFIDPVEFAHVVESGDRERLVSIISMYLEKLQAQR